MTLDLTLGAVMGSEGIYTTRRGWLLSLPSLCTIALDSRPTRL